MMRGRLITSESPAEDIVEYPKCMTVFHKSYPSVSLLSHWFIQRSRMNSPSNILSGVAHLTQQSAHPKNSDQVARPHPHPQSLRQFPNHRLYPMATAREWDRHDATDTCHSRVARALARKVQPSASRSHRRVARPKRAYASDTPCHVCVWKHV